MKRLIDWLGRPAVIGSLVGVLIAVIAASLALHFNRSAAIRASSATPAPSLQGTDLRNHPAPVFSLTGQNGTTVSLQALRGHPVVLTFLDATCTEQCPLMIQYLNWTATQFLGPQQTAQVEWVAISVNPNNTPAQVTAFMVRNKPVMKLRFLPGTQAQLAPLWKAYYIAAQPGQSDVVHTSGLYVIDQEGRERVWLDAGFDPSMLGADLKILLTT